MRIIKKEDKKVKNNMRTNMLKRVLSCLMAFMVCLTAFPVFNIQAADERLTIQSDNGVENVKLFEVKEIPSDPQNASDPIDPAYEEIEVSPDNDGKYEVDAGKSYLLRAELDDPEENVLVSPEISLSNTSEEPSKFSSEKIDGTVLMGKTIRIISHNKEGYIKIYASNTAVVEVFDMTNGGTLVTKTGDQFVTDYLHTYKIKITTSIAMNFVNATQLSYSLDKETADSYEYVKTIQYEDVEDILNINIKRYSVEVAGSSLGNVYTSVEEETKFDNTSVEYGTNQTLYIVPNSLYLIEKVKKNGVDITSEVAIDSETTIGTLNLSGIKENIKIEVEYKAKQNVNAKTLEDAGINITAAGTSVPDATINTPDESRLDHIYYYIPENWSSYYINARERFSWNLSEMYSKTTHSHRRTESMVIDSVVDNKNHISFSPSVLIVHEHKKPDIIFDSNWTSEVKYISSSSGKVTFTGKVSDKGEYVQDSFVTATAGIKYFTYSTNATYSPDLTPVLTSDGNFSITLDANPTTDTTYHFFASDKCGNLSSVSKQIVIDNEAPVISSVSVDSSDYVSSGDECYTKNETVTVSVYVTDEKSGLKTVELYRDGVKLGIEPEISNGVAVFKNVPIDHDGRNAFYAKAIDNLGNITEEGTTEKVTPAAIYYDNVAPNIELNTEVYKADVEGNPFYFLNADELNTLEFVVEQVVADSNRGSGIAKIEVYINGVYQSEDADGNSFAITDKTTKVTHKLRLEDTNRDMHTIRIQAESKTGVDNTKTYVIKNDKEAPVVDNNVFAVNKELRATFDKLFLSEASLDYAFFAKEAFDMTFDVTDMISGINAGKLGYYFLDEEGEKIGEDSYDLTISENATRTHLSATISVPTKIKGYVRLFLEDNVGNQSVLMTKGIIVESQAEHEASKGASVTIQPERTDVAKDAQGLLLFNKDTFVSVKLTDAFTGISSVKWSVSTENNGELVYEDEVSVDANGVISSNTHGVNWEVAEDGMNQNLVTALVANIPVTVNSNNIKVSVTMTDNAGNTSTEEYRLSVDKTAPVVNVEFNNVTPKQNNVYNANRVATVTIYERNFSSNLVTWDIVSRHGNVASVRFVNKVENADPDKNAYIYEVVFASDDDYDFTVSCKDMAGLTSNVVTEKTFTIDKTAPVITVSMSGTAVNDKYFAADRTATVTVVEHNFDPANFVLAGSKYERAIVSAWQTTGDTHVITVLFNADDVYTLNVSGMDMGGNEATPVAVAEFVIDKTIPQFTFGGVAPNSANNGDVAPTVSFTDTNFDAARTSIRLVGDNRGEVATGYWSADQKTFVIPNIEKIQANDDIYTLIVNAVDMAGNTKSESIRFSANRFGSTYSFDENTRGQNGKYARELFDVVLTEINVDELDMSTVKLSVSFNGSTVDLAEGEHYSVEKSHINGGWCSYVYTIDKNVFASDGAYTVRAYSVDAAGNKNDSTDASKKAEISFGIDRTRPMIKPLNLKDHGRYPGKSYRAQYQLTDNLSSVGGYEVYIDGEEVEAIVEGDMIVFDIPESSSKHEIEIKAFDMAGNEVEDLKSEILVNDHPLVRALGSTQAAVAVAAAGGTAVVGGGTATGLVFRRKRLMKIKSK